MADEKPYGWGRIMEERALTAALKEMGGVVIQPHQRRAGFDRPDRKPTQPERDEPRG